MLTGTVPIDNLAPRESTPYVPPFGKGRYSVELTGEFETLAGKNGWEAVKVFFANGGALNGAVTPTDGSVISTTFTTAHDSSTQALEIGANQLTALAYALGIAEVVTGDDGNKSAVFSYENAEDAIAHLQAGVGTRVGITVTHKLRKVTSDNGEDVTYTDMNITQVFLLGDLEG